MKKVIIAMMVLGATLSACSQKEETKTEDNKSEINHGNHGNHEGEDNHHNIHGDHHGDLDHHHGTINMDATYTFLSISTAKPGKLEDLVRIASSPSELMDEHVDGLLARQVSVDTTQNSVVVWVTFDKRESMMEYLNTEQGKNEHGDEDMDSILETFKMYDLSPQSQRLIPKH